MAKLSINQKEIRYLEYVNRESGFIHPGYDEDMLQYELIKAGDMKAVEVAVQGFDADIQGRISDDPVRNMKYLFVAATTLTCRYAILGGMKHQEAYNASDLYIRKMDLLKDIDSIKRLHLDMVTFYTQTVANSRRDKVYSLQIVKCIDYIFDHLNDSITVKTLADITGLNPSYLSVLFKKEMGISVSEYIRKQKIDTACNMLIHSDYSYSEISAILGFSSQSHFTKLVREATGMTPKEYRTDKKVSVHF